MTILYQSTRGRAPELDLRGVTLAGLAADGGLYVPKAWPRFSAADLAAMKGAPYCDVAFRVLRPFTAGALPDDILKELLRKAYASFADPKTVAPLRQLDERLWVLELFHGPTLAFKDVALQLLGFVFEYFLTQTGACITVLGATSGDTGPAAMAALAGRKNIDVFILYPHKGPSEIQRRQMTGLAAPNVHALAIEGTFDDCQAIVKKLFADARLREKYQFAAINSINWLRLLAQTVYYFAAAAAFAPKPVSFAVPTGNFGNVYAGYAALQCGVPVSKLAVASNRNDTLARFFATGRLRAEGVQATLSPSMDIQVSSNLERLLFDLCGRDGAKVRAVMEQIATTGAWTATPVQFGMARQVFTAAHADDALTLQTIAEVYKQSGYVLDPHSAVGVAVAKQLARELPAPVICLATAHPAKFPDAIRKAIGAAPELPDSIKALLQKPERTTLLPADAGAVEKFIAAKIAS